MTAAGGGPQSDLRRAALTPSSSPNDALPLVDARQLSFNQATAEWASLRAVVDACARHGVPGISVWRHKLAEVGVDVAARLIRDAGLHVSSVCRGGMFPAASAAERAARIDDSRRAIDEAAALGAEVLVLVCGAAPNRDISAAREMVADGIAAIAPYAAERHVGSELSRSTPRLRRRGRASRRCARRV